MENWQFVDRKACGAIRREAAERFRPEKVEGISGSDIDREALTLCRRHIRQAGLQGRIEVYEADLRNLAPLKPQTCVITNPPYGERLSNRKDSEALYRGMRRLEAVARGGPVCVLSANPAFERLYGRRANKKRRLYNGRLECEFLIF